MTLRPASAVALRSARATDLPAILELEGSGFPAREQWSEASWRAELEGADRIVLVATGPSGLRGSEAADPYYLRGVITFQVGPDTADLLRVVVAPASRGRKVGRALVRAGLMQVCGRGVERVLLEVRHDNAPAIALYTGCGFSTLTVRADYYGPGADALVMSAPVETDLPPLLPPRPKGNLG